MPTAPAPTTQDHAAQFDRIVEVHRQIEASTRTLCDSGIQVLPHEVAGLSVEDEAAVVGYVTGPRGRETLDRLDNLYTWHRAAFDLIARGIYRRVFGQEPVGAASVSG